MRHDKTVPSLVIFNQIEGVFGDMGQHIQTHEIRGFKHGGFGPSHRLSEKRIHFGNRQAVFDHHLNRLDHALNADPVADEIGGILGPNDPFAQNPLTVFGHEFEHLRQRLLAGDDLQQFHITHRIEKMRP